jgi:electron transfer flavoprotein beta subunit
MKIIVLVKQVPDTYGERKLDPSTGLLDREAGDPIVDEINERALEVALRYKDKNKGTEVVALSMGPESVTAALRKALSMGADSAVHVLDDELSGSDLGWTSTALAAAVAKTGYDLIIAGNESTDGRGGLVPVMLAEHLSLPHLSFLDSVDFNEDVVSGERGTESGSLAAHATLPAVISVTERAAEARFPNFKGMMTAKRKPLTVLALSDLGLDPAHAFAGVGRSVIKTTIERPARTAGRKIIDEGNAGVELAEFLAAGRLI